MGVEVTLIDGRERLLPFLDSEISELLRERLASLGLKFLFQERAKGTELGAGGVRMTLASGKIIEAETAMLAAGRRGALVGLGLERAGLGINQRGNIDVNAHYQTHARHIYAAGDVIGFPALASTSMEQGRVAMCHAFGFPYKQRLASQLPMGIYTIPEISAVGETQESCEIRKISYQVGRAKYVNNARGQMIGESTGMLKLIFRPENRQLLGVQIFRRRRDRADPTLAWPSFSNPAAPSTPSSSWFSISQRFPNSTSMPRTMASATSPATKCARVK